MALDCVATSGSLRRTMFAAREESSHGPVRLLIADAEHVCRHTSTLQAGPPGLARGLALCEDSPQLGIPRCHRIGHRSVELFARETGRWAVGGGVGGGVAAWRSYQGRLPRWLLTRKRSFSSTAHAARALFALPACRAGRYRRLAQSSPRFGLDGGLGGAAS